MGWYIPYAIVVGAGGILLLWRVYVLLRRAEEHRHTRLKKLRGFAPIQTESPLDDPNRVARKRALGNVETRFTLIRATLLPSLALLIIVLLAVPLLGAVPATILSLVVAVVGVVTGVAARPFLENFIAGLVMSFARPIRLGDTVILDGLYGTIEDISVTHTMVKVWDWRRLMVPNAQMLAKQFLNLSIVDQYVWAHVEFWVAPDADLARVEQLAVQGAKSSKSFANYEDPSFWVMELGKEGVRCWVAAWTDSPAQAWQLTHDVRTRLAMDLQQAGIRTHIYHHQQQEREGAVPTATPSSSSAPA